MEIRSYRAVFDLERRIYRVDQLRLNPTGVPVRGVLYTLALIALALICGSVPGLEVIAHALPWYLLDVVLPLGGGALLSVIAIDGRPAHLAVQALLRCRCQPRRLAGLRSARAGRGAELGACWWPQEIVMLPDGSDAHMRRLRYSGPGAVLVTVAHTCEGRRHGRWRIGASRVRLRERPCVGAGLRAGAGVDTFAGAGAGLQTETPAGAGSSDGKVIALAADATLIVG